MRPKPRVFIIILNWNGWRDTIECMESLKKLDYPNYEIVIVDNGSTDESPQILPQKFPKIKLIETGKNLGFAGGNNVGIKYALEQGANYVMLLNNDTIVDKNFLKELIKVAETKSQIGILGPKIYFHDEPNRLWFGGGKINKILTRGTHINYGKIDKNGKNPKIVDYITGCCLLAKREVIEKTGLMNGDYFLYYEDADWCLGARKKGFKCVLVPKAKIWHKCSRSAQEGSPSYIYYHSRNGLMLARYNGSFFIHLAAYLQSFWILAKQIIKLAIPSKRVWAKAVIRGIWDFYRSKVGQL